MLGYEVLLNVDWWAEIQLFILHLKLNVQNKIVFKKWKGLNTAKGTLYVLRSLGQQDTLIFGKLEVGTVDSVVSG